MANKLPDTFTDYHRGVIKSCHLARNVLERVEVHNKTTHPNLAKRGGEGLPRGRMLLQTSKRRLEMQLILWLKDT